MKVLIAYHKLLLSIFALFLIIHTSCSDEPFPSDEEKPKDNVTIGISGGSVQKGDFKITIPFGAFDKDYNISVSEVEDDGAFGEEVFL